MKIKYLETNIKKYYYLFSIIIITICLSNYQQPVFYDIRKKTIFSNNISYVVFFNTTSDLIINFSDKISLSYEITYRKITMV